MTQQASIPRPAEVDGVGQCRHHWVIQPAMGPVSQGMCQSCGEEREFKNYVEAATWGDARLANRDRVESSEAVSWVVADHLDAEEEE